ncbi:hypothetical protein [Falsiroseomonas selenitidurans]|uniref:Cytochrome c domain-containing protein n=1 Tax=Falsiroseomonas selenitidurans TaxID=2716335 RepID=A0ABX1E3B0_9PROT|nr:hypothetical protein [Falsiroseomonas selenitidurans]NKC31667.1 hypothetical protein [Falsiroseomonas selenitidurans]
MPEIPTRWNRHVPHCVSRPLHALRRRIECFVNRLKNSRRVATRHDQTADSFLGFAALSSIRLWIRFVHAPRLTQRWPARRGRPRLPRIGRGTVMQRHLSRTILLLLLAPPPAALAAGTAAPPVAQACLGCHGPAGGGAGAVPAIAGRDAGELRALLHAFRSGERPATIMDRIMRGYDEAELGIMAEHFAGAR